MFYEDHRPAHFHAYYGGMYGLIDIQTLELIRGELPARALGLVREWAALRQKELQEDWNLAQ